VQRFNELVIAADETSGAERVDVQEVARQIAAAGADPGRLSDAERDALVHRYDQAITQVAERRTIQELRSDLGSQDLQARMLAAAELQQRGELSDEQADAMVSAYNAAVTEFAAARAAGDPESWPEELREVVEAQRQAIEHLEAPVDPVDRATRMFNDFVLSQRPPSLQDQLEALGVEVEAEPEAEQVGHG
jgi:Zn-dependent M32 family carboxypeptidase